MAPLERYSRGVRRRYCPQRQAATRAPLVVAAAPRISGGHQRLGRRGAASGCSGESAAVLRYRIQHTDLHTSTHCSGSVSNKLDYRRYGINCRKWTIPRQHSGDLVGGTRVQPDEGAAAGKRTRFDFAAKPRLFALICRRISLRSSRLWSPLNPTSPALRTDSPTRYLSSTICCPDAKAACSDGQAAAKRASRACVRQFPTRTQRSRPVAFA